MIHDRSRIQFDPEEAEVDVTVNEDKKCVAVSIWFLKTGEIRQKTVAFDTLARRIFQRELKSWKKAEEKGYHGWAVHTVAKKTE